ncbi:hypothetical protein HOS33_gp053 [Erwinia phage vB_EamM_Y3]|uniref:Uncharacterized protein n=1 Tax=Erwinia phage vB_EamM_Y3 TaxID=1983553 RepID=A0A2H4IAW8_9CAUD|nr:hypothetical protein HOS33_gp053 [Erwinia phage vB_EamM_Y3]ARW58693.1 hypothetical protein Y3_053 [Erwinia phage vB_EamM_Y3]
MMIPSELEFSTLTSRVDSEYEARSHVSAKIMTYLISGRSL